MSESIRYAGLVYETFEEMQDDPNIHAGTIVITLGDQYRGDGKGGLYKICNADEIRQTDVIYPLHGKKSHLSAVYIPTTFRGKKPEGETPDLDELIALVGELEEDVNGISTTQKAQTKTMNTMTSNMSSMTNRISTMNMTLSNVENQLSDHTSSISNLGRETNDLQNSLNAQISSVTNRINSVNSSLSTHISNVNNSLNEQIQNIRSFEIYELTGDGLTYIRGNNIGDQKFLIFNLNEEEELPSIAETFEIQLFGMGDWIIPAAIKYSGYALKTYEVVPGFSFTYSPGEYDDDPTPAEEGSLDNPIPIASIDLENNKIYDENEEEILPIDGNYYILFNMETGLNTIYYYHNLVFTEYVVPEGTVDNPVVIYDIDLENNKIYDTDHEEITPTEGFYYVLYDPMTFIRTMYHYESGVFTIYIPPYTGPVLEVSIDTSLLEGSNLYVIPYV